MLPSRSPSCPARRSSARAGRLVICTRRLWGLTGALSRLDLRVPPPALPALQGFVATLGPPGLDPDSLAQFLEWLEAVEIPPLAVSPGQLAGISGAARAVIAIRTQLGFDPLALKAAPALAFGAGPARSEEHTSELPSLMRRSYAVFCLKKKHTKTHQSNAHTTILI